MTWSKVMPYLPVTSCGGPWDDHAYCAGWAMGRLDALLAEHPAELVALVDAGNREQADLIGMRHGYLVKQQGVDGEGLRLRFTRP